MMKTELGLCRYWEGKIDEPEDPATSTSGLKRGLNKEKERRATSRLGEGTTPLVKGGRIEGQLRYLGHPLIVMSMQEQGSYWWVQRWIVA